MKQENKDLLLKDLCARLPYGVKICYIYNGEECVSTIEKIDAFSYIWDNYNGCYHVKEIKPYLFPLSSMTDEQKKYINDRWGVNEDFDFEIDPNWGRFVVDLGDAVGFVNWLIENHFDIYGLIPKDLAIDATSLNIY